MSDKIEKKETAGLPAIQASPQELALVQGNLSALTPEQRVDYYRMTCQSLGLNPLTRPFDYIQLNGRLVLYARKDAADQLRALRLVSLSIVSRETLEGVYVVTARAQTPDGRTDESVGAVPLPKDAAERANAIMKAETKAKRRVTLSICGLGMLDESELDTMPRSSYQTEPEQPKAWTRPPVKELPPTADARQFSPVPVPVDARLLQAREMATAIYERGSRAFQDAILEKAEAAKTLDPDGIADIVIAQCRIHKMRLSTLEQGTFEAAVLGLEDAQP